VALAAAAAVLMSGPRPASALRTLHVDALGMRADRTTVQVGEVFHLAIHVRVRERVPALDELVIPDVGTMQILGDERHATSSPAGTDVVETLTLEARAPGTFTFNGAYLDAIDARTRKPSRFSANPVRVVVAGGGTSFVVFHPLNVVWLLAGIVFAGTAAIVAVALIVTVVRQRRQPHSVPAPVAVEPAPPRPRTARDAVADALRTYRTAPSHEALMRLRSTLFGAAGVNAGATLRDALAATNDRGLHAALIAAERTAFGPAHARDASSVELIDATEAWLQ
jgi:hypothetical protein